MATITAVAGGGNWNATGTWDTGTVPTSADEVILNGTSGNVTVNVASACRSLDCNGYTGTLTLNSAITLSIGDGTAGTGNRALRLVSGMTLTANSTSQFDFVSTSGTQQTVDTAGKTVVYIRFNGAGGSWILSGALTCTRLIVFGGTFDTGNYNLTISDRFDGSGSTTRVINLGSSTIGIAGSAGWNAPTTTNMTLNAGTSTINFTAASATIDGGGVTFYAVNLTGSSVSTVQGNNTYTNFTRTGTAVKTSQLQVLSNQTVTGTLTLSGNSATNRLYVFSNTPGTSRTFTAATVSCSNVDFEDITGAGAGSWNLASISGNSGDCGGNSGITFTTAATQTWSGTSGGNWSANAWTSRVPLPQDDVVINAAFSAGQTVTADMPRMGKSIDFTGANAVTWGFTSTATRIYGSVTHTSSVTVSGTVSTTLCGRSSFTVTSAGKNWGRSLTVSCPSGTYTLSDALNLGSGSFTITDGTFDAGGFDVTCNSFTAGGNNSKTLTLGSGTMSATSSSGTAFSFAGTGLTLNRGTSTLSITDAGASGKTFAGSGFTFHNLSIASGGAGAITITGSNTFNSIAVTGGGTKTISFTAGTTQTLTGGAAAFPQGASGNLVTCQSTSNGSAYTISSATSLSTDYISLRDCTGSGGTPFYAGANSTNVSGNTNWSFSAPGSGSLLTFISRLRSLTGGTA